MNNEQPYGKIINLDQSKDQFTASGLRELISSTAKQRQEVFLKKIYESMKERAVRFGLSSMRFPLSNHQDAIAIKEKLEKNGFRVEISKKELSPTCLTDVPMIVELSIFTTYPEI